MPLTLDIFNEDAFGLVEMTGTMEALPYAPKLLGKLGLFSEKRIRVLYAAIEEKEGRLSLIPTSPRGTMNRVHVRGPRKERVFKVPHVPYYGTVLADDVQGVRAFGEESELETVMEVVAEHLTEMKNDHEATREWHRIGAVKGKILDADTGFTEIYDLYDEFDITQKTATFDFGDSLADVSDDIIGQISGNLGGTTFGQIYCICGSTFYRAAKRHPEAIDLATLGVDLEWFRSPGVGKEFYSMAVQSIEFNGIIYINYRGQVGTAKFVEDDEGYYFPSGVPGMFQEIIAPADFIETVNTLGRPIYVSQERLPHNKGIELHTQSNILAMNTRLGAVVKATVTGYPPA